MGSDSLVTSAATGLSGGAEEAGDFGDAVEKGGGFAGFGGAREGQVDGEVVGDAAGGEDDDAGRKEDGFGDGVGDEDGGPALAFAEGEQFFVEVFAGEFVEGTERFVEQEELRFEGEGAGEGDAHFFAAGELARVAVGEGSDAGKREQFGHASVAFGGGRVAKLEERGGVLADGAPREEGGVLEDEGALGGRGGRGVGGDQDLAGGGFGEAGEETEQC